MKAKDTGNQPNPRELDRTLRSVEDTPEARKLTVIADAAETVLKAHRIVRFKGRAMQQADWPYPHYRPLAKSQFDELAYPILGGLTRGKMADIYAYVCSMADDLTENQHLIAFGYRLQKEHVEADTDLDPRFHTPSVWDMKALATITHIDADDCVWRSPHSKLLKDEGSFTVQSDDGRLHFIMSLAGGDPGLYDDIMQSIAPLVMQKKPDGVIWWVGSGANGKSTLMDALYRIFPRHLADITIKRLVDGRDAPGLNGVLGNVVKESSEGRIDDTTIYKALGTHENFRVHRFHSQDDIEVNGNIHTIFSGNSIPIFADKGHSIRRRTFVIPFNQEFRSDPDFEQKTFTPEFFGRLIMEICKYAAQIKARGYQYKWSKATTSAKKDYDRESSNTEEYASRIIDDGVVAFQSFHPLRIDYENWCAEQGYVPFGVTNLRKAVTAAGFERSSIRGDQNSVSHIYRLRTVDGKAGLQQFGLGRLGLYTLTGFQHDEDPEPPDEPEQKSFLKGEW